MFIVLEGIDGSGKSTQIASIVQWLETHGVAHDNILVTREPTHDGEFGMQIRKILSGEAAMSVSPIEFQKFYVQDRKDHLEKVVVPHMQNRDNIVLCDRYFLSTFAYGRAGGVTHEDIEALHKTILKEAWIMPDITLLIDVSAETAMKRLKQRNKGKSPEYFERKKEFLQTIADEYRKVAALFPNVVIVDGEKPAEEVSQSINKILFSQTSLCTKQS